MTISAAPADTAQAVLAEARLLRRTADRAEQVLLLRVCEWADLHPALEPHDNLWDDESVPSFAWDALSELGLALGLPDDAARSLVRESLELRHRLPRVWRRVVAGDLVAWRARRIAQRTIGQPADVAAALDASVARIAHKVGPVTLARLLDEALLRLHGEERELAQLEALDGRHVRVLDQLSEGGVGSMEIRADWKDVSDFDQMLSVVARVLAERGSAQTLDVRRAMAVGVLADPAAAAQLLAGASVTPVHKQVVLTVHLSEAALRGHDVAGRLETGGDRPVLEQQVREWCGRSDTHVVVKPVVDLRDQAGVEQYEVPDRLAARSELLHGRCVSPGAPAPPAGATRTT